MSNGAPDYAFPAQVYVREVAGQMVLLNLATESYYGLDEVGARIVSSLVERPKQDAIDAIVDAYDVDPSVLDDDVTALIQELLAAGLLEETHRR